VEIGIKENYSELVNDRPTYGKYQELLQCQREKTSRFFNGWTKAGRCELVAKEILARLTSCWGIEMADKNLLLEVLITEVLPKVDEKCRARITEEFYRVLPGVNKKCREKDLSQKSGALERLFGEGYTGQWKLSGITVKVEGDEKDNLIDQLYILFVEKLKGYNEIDSIYYTFKGISKDKILGFVSLLNRINIAVDNAKTHIDSLQKLVEGAPDAMKVISEFPAKESALIKILDLSGYKAQNLLDIIKAVLAKEQKEILIDQLYTLFVDKLKDRPHHILSCIGELKGIAENEIADFIVLLNSTNIPDDGLDSAIRDLKELVKNKPNAARPIIELLEMVPAKKDALIKILKLPGGVDAVLDLLEILKMVPTMEQKEILVDQIHTYFTDHFRRAERPSLSDYLSSFQTIAENERVDFIFVLNELLLANKNWNNEKFDTYIQFFKNCPVEERGLIGNQAKRFLINLGNQAANYTPNDALHFVRAIPTEEMRNNFIDQIPVLQGDSPHRYDPSGLLYLFLFPNEEDRINQAANLRFRFYGLPIQKQATLLVQAQRTFAGLGPIVGNPFDAVLLLKEKIAENERENFIDQIPSLAEQVNRLNGLANNVKLQILLFIFQRVAPLERAEFIQHVSNLRVSNILIHLESLLALPANERADRVEAINLQIEIETAQNGLIHRHLATISIDPADFSDEARNPTRPLLQLFEEINQNERFPRIKYKDSDGSDAGGLTRDFVSQIFQALCHSDQKSLPFMVADGRYLPKVEAGPLPTLPLEDQVKCYKAIGMLFARAINGDPSLSKGKDSVTVGAHFHSNMFAMIHALTLDEVKLIPDPLLDDSVPEIKQKLTKFYLKSQFPQLFRPNGVEESVIDDEIVKLMNGEVSQRLQDSGVDPEEDFLKDYSVNSIIQATLVIAKSMHKTLALSDKWAELIGNSPEALSKKIEGSLTSDLVINAFGLKDEAEDTRKGMVKRWIRTASPEALKNFVFSLTGSTSLAPGQQLSVQLCEVLNNPENAPVFHTCGQYMDLPKYETYEIFEAKLAISVASAIVGGFQVA
jgi:hypothetical protein